MTTPPSDPSQAAGSASQANQFLLRWRGKQEGPFSIADIERRIETNQIGLLHEIYFEEDWMPLRKFLELRSARAEAERLQREEAERRIREQQEQEAREREAQQREALLAEERRKNDLLEAAVRQQRGTSSSLASGELLPHRGGTILTFAILGLFVCFPFSIAAWTMGNTDLREMNAGRMDPGGKSLTSSGRTIGVLGTLLWVAGLLLFGLGSLGSL